MLASERFGNQKSYGLIDGCHLLRKCVADSSHYVVLYTKRKQIFFTVFQSSLWRKKKKKKEKRDNLCWILEPEEAQSPSFMPLLW